MLQPRFDLLVILGQIVGGERGDQQEAGSSDEEAHQSRENPETDAMCQSESRPSGLLGLSEHWVKGVFIRERKAIASIDRFPMACRFIR
jgi:hypothetical protein